MKKELYAKLLNNKDDIDLEKFDIGHIFKINDIDIGQSSTTLYLDCEDDLGFNSVYFSILDKNLQPYDLHKFEEQTDIYNEFLDVLNYNDAKYMLYLYDLMIDTKVVGITVGEDHCKLLISSGEITIWKDNKIEKCIRPDNVIMVCKYCYRLYSQYGDCIGYIYVE